MHEVLRLLTSDMRLKIGIPGMLSVSTDWAFEVCAIIAGVLGQTSLAAQHVVLTVNTLLLMIPR